MSKTRPSPERLKDVLKALRDSYPGWTGEVEAEIDALGAENAWLEAALRSTKSSLMGCWCETPTIDENGHHQHDERCDKIRAALGGP